MVQAPGQIIVNSYFDKRRGRALGIAQTGCGLGSFLLPPLIASLFREFTFSGAFLILAAINLHICVGSMFFRPLENNNGRVFDNGRKQNSVVLSEKTEKEQDQITNVTNQHNEQISNDGPNSLTKTPLFHFSICTDVRFIVFSLALVFIGMGTSNMTFLAPLVQELGFELWTASLIVSLHGVSDMVGRLLFGFLLDYRCLYNNKPHVFYVVLFVCGLAQVGMGFVSYKFAFLPVIAVRGMCITMVQQKITIISDILERHQVASANGFATFTQGIGVLVGPLVGGK